jgi:hypothetical protein
LGLVVDTEPTLSFPNVYEYLRRARDEHDREAMWDEFMAEAVGLLVTALVSLENLSAETSSDPQFEATIASVSRKVFDAVSSLDHLSVTDWVRPASSPNWSRSYAAVPTWWACVDR